MVEEDRKRRSSLLNGYVREPSLSTSPVLVSPELQPQDSSSRSRVSTIFMNSRRGSLTSTPMIPSSSSSDGTTTTSPRSKNSTIPFFRRNQSGSISPGSNLPSNNLPESSSSQIENDSRELNQTISRDSNSSRTSINRLRSWASRSGGFGQQSTPSLEDVQQAGVTSRIGSPSRSNSASTTSSPTEETPSPSTSGSRRPSGYGFFRQNGRSNSNETNLSSNFRSLDGMETDAVDDYVIIPLRREENSEINSTRSSTARVLPTPIAPTIACLPPYESISTFPSANPSRNSSSNPLSLSSLPMDATIAIAGPSNAPFPTFPRRRNFDNLSLSSNRAFSPVVDMLNNSTSIVDDVFHTPESEVPSPSEGATLTRMRTLPRLLSSHGYANNGTNTETETEQEETEDDEGSETDTDDDSEEGAELSRRVTPLVRISSPAVDSRELSQRSSTATLNSRTTLTSTPFNNPPPRAQNRTSRPVTASDRSPSSLRQPLSCISPATTSSWARFPPPSSSPLRINTNSAAGYFDLPRQTNSPRTPGAPMMTPLLPMSASSQARGRMPQYEPIVTPGLESITTQLSPRARRHSATELISPAVGRKEELGIATLDEIWQVVGGPTTPGPSFLASPISSTMIPLPSPGLLLPEILIPKLSRPRSMYEMKLAPPAYHSVYARPGHAQIVYPREDEGKERLPNYTCSVHIEGYMQHKKEFVQPNVQAKDRTWKKVFLVLHGTAIKIYKYDLKSHPIQGEEDWSLVCADGPPSTHFHVGEFQNFDSTTTTSAGATFLNEAKGKVKSRLPIGHGTGGNTLLRHYTLQNGESGLAADYIKRKHVVRVRAEGEQFLLQCKDDRGVIDLIEALQAATNVSLDLDSRPLPKFITLGRRRRRRPRNPRIEVEEGNAAIEAVAQRIREDSSRLTAMLEEEQAYSSTRADVSVV